MSNLTLVKIASHAQQQVPTRESIKQMLINEFDVTDAVAEHCYIEWLTCTHSDKRLLFLTRCKHKSLLRMVQNEVSNRFDRAEFWKKIAIGFDYKIYELTGVEEVPNRWHKYGIK